MEKLSMIGHVKDTPRVVKKTYETRNSYMTEFVNAFVNHDFKKVYFLGSGTSHNVSLVVRNIFVELLNVEGVACPPTIFTFHEKVNPNGVYKKEEICVICLSQHGDSISTTQAAKKAQEEGYFTIAVTETLNSIIEQFCDVYCHLVCEREEIGPETRGYTQTIFQAYIMAIEIAKAKGIINEERYKKLDNDAKELSENLHIVVEESINWYNNNREDLLKMTKSSICGYGVNYPTALEARLKLFETFSRPCTGYEMEEQLHGPLRGYNQDNYIFMIISEGGYEFTRACDVVAYYKRAITKHVYVITAEDGVDITDADLKFSIKTSDILSPMIYVIPFQVLSALLCEDIGIDTKVSPIKDRSLSSHYENDRYK
ncbi:MAG TPA: SIS domain-containing protein [Erysipelotrichaceae bacterium]|jgi:glucosamine 6-phosphate synthetase-like amidotransferase/phosphosugar isomerase protein|nr:SIS domain-containing protein [Erysipelotrichia bacterium]HPX32069.1 SIS domain-containing protein [Erysipelotrichaceae bacterium]HQA84890.1 SIS domain-containing protein [Erysipelotrichaceae bacterium]